MRALEADVDSAARSDAKVLITGETGAGKEVIARLIHERSARASSPMVTLNCAGLPDSLLESELFGHVKGSFTGAYRDKPGLLETAPNGTVFLDEVGEMSPRMQVVLLRFLETGEIQRIGADRAHTRVNVRLITATNRNLEAEVAAGTFREDLFFRLNVIRLSVPPLRERVDDILPLVEYYLSVYCQAHRVPPTEMSPESLAVLAAYRWPGNVRELKNVIERVVLKNGGRLVRPADLPV
jgi:transcriptional regulator with GAF, ATPase, and Fis domain